MERSFAWVKADGAEYTETTVADGRLTATGTMVGGAPLPYRVFYELTTDTEYRTSRLMVRADGQGWGRTLELARLDDGGWTVSPWSQGEPELPSPGGDPAPLRDALDCDVQGSALTNTMPVLRHGLHRGLDPYSRTVHFVMVFVSVPSLTVRAVEQHYTPLDRGAHGATIRYASGDFSADVVFDTGGFVVDYPDLGRRVTPRS